VKVSAITPVGEVRDLVWVNRYNMYWQTEYLFKKPLVIRKGTIVRVAASYDNSWQNMNLDPGQPLHDARWGMKAEDEMLAVFLEWVDQPAN
jgi:hypothetical protein